jgi:hypothetical protein
MIQEINGRTQRGFVMAVKLIDLQLIYGLAGAREKFEDLAFDLIHAEEPRAQKVRVSQGDGGIDAHVNNLSDPRGVHIYQCKFFPKGLDDAQKGQIRDSFKRCRESTDFTLKRWTLCLPVDLSVPERQWFEGWRETQKASGVIIDDPWGASILEGLLRKDKNKGLRDDYFKEEFVVQIGDMHGIVQQLAGRVDEVLREREAAQTQTKQAEILNRQAEELARFVQSLRDFYLARLGKAARDMGFPSKQPAHWEVVIRPSWIPAQPRMTTLRECWEIVEACRVGSNGWEYPVVRRGDRQPGQDWVGITKVRDFDVECWRFSEKGLFAHMFPIWDDVKMIDQKPDLSHWDIPNRVPPQHFFDIDVSIRTLTHVFRFAAKLAEHAFDPADGAVDVSVRLNGTRDRALMTWEDIGRLRNCYKAAEAALENRWHCPRAQLFADPDAFAITAASWFFERFGWHAELEGLLAKLQRRIFSPH